MSEPLQRRRVLLAAEDRLRAEFRGLFATEALAHWEVMEADSLERARFVLQLAPCDVLLLEGGLCCGGSGDELAWLAGQRRAPVLFVSDGEPETVAAAVRREAGYRLPGEVARRHPQVLAIMLQQAAEFGDLQRRGQETSEALEDARRQVGRLVNLLWQAVPGEGRARWFTQRHMLERLEEEVIRAQRYGGPFAVILGEVEELPPRPSLAADAGPAATWTVEQISHVKRRSDVAGQYGLQGFMMLLPQTNERGAAGCCRRLRDILEQPPTPGPFGPLRVHFGIACFGPEAQSVKGLLRRAEERLEHSKLGPVEEASV
jgi:diguanylate cyclase (GGDEF)-like protein